LRKLFDDRRCRSVFVDIVTKIEVDQSDSHDPRTHTKFHEEELVLFSVIWWIVCLSFESGHYRNKRRPQRFHFIKICLLRTAYCSFDQQPLSFEARAASRTSWTR
jgi:hypothetical protein